MLIAHDHPELAAGGAQLAAYNLFRHVARREDFDVCFIAAHEDPTLGSGQTRIVQYRDRSNEFLLLVSNFNRFLLSQTSPQTIGEFRTFLEIFRPDVVHFHHYAKVGVELIGAARQVNPDVRIVITLHEYMAICHHYGLMVTTNGFALCETPSDQDCGTCFKEIGAALFAKRRNRIMAHLSQADLFIAPSAFLKNRYVTWGIPAQQITVLENGIEPVLAHPHKARLPDKRRGRFGFFGQINPFKGLDCLIAALDHLARMPEAHTRDIRLTIHGAHLEANHPDYVVKLKRSLARHAATIEFAGAYSQEELPRLMAKIDWVVVPSIWWENSPLVIQEAFNYRRPVICSDIGGMREKVRPGKDGFHFPVGDSAALAVLMSQVASDTRIWDRLQSTMSAPMTISESAARHVDLYRTPQKAPDLTKYLS